MVAREDQELKYEDKLHNEIVERLRMANVSVFRQDLVVLRDVAVRIADALCEGTYGKSMVRFGSQAFLVLQKDLE